MRHVLRLCAGHETIKRAVSRSAASTPARITVKSSRSLSISTDSGIARLSAKQRQAIDAMVFKGLRPFQVMAETGLSESTVYRALASPAGRRYYEMQLQVLRSGERGRNVKTAVDIRDDAKGQAGKTRIEAMKFIEGWDHRGNQQNINVNVGVSVQPGYIVDIGQHRSEAADILQLSGSVKNVLDDQ